MGQTRYYSLAYFDFGDQLDSPLNIQKEVDRFVMIDKQLYGLYNVFGNGVISDWTVSDNGYSTLNGISISVSSGIGIINYMAAETSVTGYVNHLQTNSILYVYASYHGSTVRTRNVNFIVSTSDSLSSLVKLAKLTTGTDSIISIDNTVRDLVGFEAIIKAEIDEHKHRGTPSKIDLQDNVKNQLPGARLADIDASKITSGIFGVDRIPIIDHNELNDNGLMTHAALDTFVKTLSQSNKELLGEIASANLLKIIIYLRYLYSNVDEHFINELTLIPGVTSNTIIDFDNSTANINLIDRCISGVPAKRGVISSVVWNNQYSFYNAYVKDQVVVSNGEVTLERRGSNIDMVDDFERTGAGLDVGYTKEISFVNTEIAAVTDGYDDSRVEGKYGGKFSADTGLMVTYTKDLKVKNSDGVDVGRDWVTDYDELVLWVKTNSNNHEAVYYYLINGDINPGEEGFDQSNQIGPFTLIEKDYYTSNTDSSRNNFEEIIINLADLRSSGKNMNNLTKLVFYTGEVSDDFSFLLDNIYARRTNLVSPNGTIRLRYSTQAKVNFQSIFFDTTIYSGTNIRVRARVASDTDLLTRSSYTSWLSSGEVIAIDGTAVEIEITLSTTDSSVSPVLKEVELRMLSDSDFYGFDIDTADEWNQGTLNNLSIQAASEGTSSLSVEAPINVNGYYFSFKDTVSENNVSNEGEFGFDGSSLFPSPSQAANWINSPFIKFDYVTSIVRKYNKDFIVADTFNNRVLRMDSSGNLVKGFGSSYTIDSANFYPLSVVYNSSSYILSLVFSKLAVVEDISKISLYMGSVKVVFVEGEDIVVNSKKAEGRIVEIQLSEDNYVKLAGYSGDLFASFDGGAFTESIVIGDNISGLFDAYGRMKCFIGDFTYIDNIQHPIFTNILTNDNWIVANVSNSSLMYTKDHPLWAVTTASESYKAVPDLIEFKESTQVVEFSSSDVTFSDFSLGSISESSLDTFMIAGIEINSGTSFGISGADFLSNFDDDSITDSIRFRAAAIDALDNYRGALTSIDRESSRYHIFYNSSDGLFPANIDLYTNDEMLVAESSFADASGRLIKLDTFGNVRWNFGSGSFNVIHSAKLVANSNIMISL
jgi:hypothetical protein